MAFPTSRETTYAPGSQVESADLNAIQDRIVGFKPIVVADIVVTPDHTTDRLTAGAPHGLENADGPFRLTTTGTIPTGLSTSTDYWIRTPFSDSVTLFPTQADAVAGSNQVLFTSNGTGTTTLVDTATTTRLFDVTFRRDVTVNGIFVTPILQSSGATVTILGALQVNGTALFQAETTCAAALLVSTSTASSYIKGNALRASAPSTGTHAVGEIVLNGDPIAGGFIGWVCTTAGTPGTWKSWGVISA